MHQDVEPVAVEREPRHKRWEQRVGEVHLVHADGMRADRNVVHAAEPGVELRADRLADRQRLGLLRRIVEIDVRVPIFYCLIHCAACACRYFVKLPPFITLPGNGCPTMRSASSAQSIRWSRSMPVSMPISCAMNTRSSVQMLPAA